MGGYLDHGYAFLRGTIGVMEWRALYGHKFVGIISLQSMLDLKLCLDGWTDDYGVPRVSVEGPRLGSLSEVSPHM